MVMHNKKHSQCGFTLLEVGIAITISILFGMLVLWPKANQFRSNKAAAQGTQLLTASNAVATYETTYYSELVNGTPIPGFASIYAPTIDELRNAHLLPANFSSTNSYGGGYSVVISKVPALCVPPACDITAITYLTNPIINPQTGRIDGAALGAAAAALGADGGYSTMATPASITGAAGAWSVNNPAGNVAGILGMRAGYGSSGWAQFLRRDGQLPMTGSLNMGSQNINNANTLNSTAIANTGNATIGGSLNVSGQTSTNGINNAGTLTTGNTTINGRASITGNTAVGGTLAVTGSTTTAGITNNGDIQNNGNIVATGTATASKLLLTSVVAVGDSCAGFAGYQAETSSGSIVSCVNGAWANPSSPPSPPLLPCSATTVSFNGCTGTVPTTLSGATASVSLISGSGAAVYSCNNGSWAFQSGSCTPQGNQCLAQTINWSGSGGVTCSGSVPALSSGGAQWVNSSNGNNGTSWAQCNNGVITQSSQTCSLNITYYGMQRSKEGYVLASNPNQQAIFCASKGKSAYYPDMVGADFGGQNITYCHTTDGYLSCSPHASGSCLNLKNSNHGGPGCWLQTQFACK